MKQEKSEVDKVKDREEVRLTVNMHRGSLILEERYIHKLETNFQSKRSRSFKKYCNINDIKLDLAKQKVKDGALVYDDDEAWYNKTIMLL